ncbi:MAG: hypothetical protein AAF318_11970 [Pseudomonadota bacterium]
MIRTLLLLAAFTLALPAAADARPNTRNLSCAATQALIAREGAITLSTGRHTFNRFVSGGAICGPLARAVPTFTPTADERHCRLLTCQRFRSMDGRR